MIRVSYKSVSHKKKKTCIMVFLVKISFWYSRHPLSRIFTMSNFSFVTFCILINFPCKSVRCLKHRYLKFSLCRTIFSVALVIFGLFPIPYLKHWHEVFEWIILFISGIQMLITALTKLCLENRSYIFSTFFLG